MPQKIIRTKVNTPDGGAMYVNHPEGASEEQIFQYAQQQLEQETQNRPTPEDVTNNENSLRMQSASQAVDLLVSTPFQGPHPVSLDTTPEDSPLLPGGHRAESPTDYRRLANQAWARGVDIHTGSPTEVRFGQGLADLKDPQLKQIMVDSHFRRPLIEAGIPWPENLPVAFVEEQTGELAYVRPITQAEIDEGYANPEDLGRARITLVNNPGIDKEDMAQFLPLLPTMAAQTITGAAAAMLLKSPQAALATSSVASGAIEALASPIKNRLLRDYYGLSEEEIARYSDPNEALKQGMFAGGMEFGMGQAMVLGRWAKGQAQKRTLTQDDYDAITEELDAVRKLQAEYYEATGIAIDDPLMFAQAASYSQPTPGAKNLAMWMENQKKKLPPKLRRMYASQNELTRHRLRLGFDEINNSTAGYRDGVHHLGLDENGLVMPIEDVTTIGEQIAKRIEKDYGLQHARDQARGHAIGPDPMEYLHEVVSKAHYSDMQSLARNSYTQAQANETIQWAFFKSHLEPGRGVGNNGIKIRNPRGSRLNQTLDRFNSEARANLSKSMGDATENFVADLDALRAGELDIMEMHKLKSGLLRAKRKIEAGTDTSGWTEHEIDEVIFALDQTMKQGDWFRVSTGRSVPARRDEAMRAYTRAGEATAFTNQVARRQTTQDLINQISVWDGAIARRFGERRRFEMTPGQAYDSLWKQGDATALVNLMDLSGHHPGVRAALAADLEGIYKGLATNADGSFKMGGYKEFMQKYGDHVSAIFDEKNARRIMTADDWGRQLEKLNRTADQVEAAYRKAFGDTVDPSKLGAVGVVDNMMSSDTITAAESRRLMNRLKSVSPELHESVRAEFAQYTYAQLAKNPMELGDGNALFKYLNQNEAKISAVMGAEYVKNMRLIARMTQYVDYSDAVRSTAEPIQAAWLQVTRSVFGPLSRKQRFMTAANRVLRGHNARKAMDLMADPDQLKNYIQLGKMDPKSLIFWTKAADLGLQTHLEDAGFTPPEEWRNLRAKEEAWRRLAEGGPM